MPLSNESSSALLRKVKNNDTTARNAEKIDLLNFGSRKAIKNFLCHNTSFCLHLIMGFSQSKSVYFFVNKKLFMRLMFVFV